MKYSQTISLLLFLVPVMLFCQNKTIIDSLLNAYNKQKSVTLKVQTINHLVNYYMYRTPEKAKYFAKEQLKLAEQLNYKTGVSLANYQLGILNNNNDKLDSAKYFYNKSLEIAKELQNHTHISQAYRGLAILEFSQGNLNEADSINEIDLFNAKAQNDSIGIALAYDFKSTINQNKGYYSIALSNVLKGLQIFEQLGDSIRIADCYNHLATIEHNLGNLLKAISYNEKALEIYINQNDIYYQAQVLNDIGVMYNLLRQPKKALEYFKRSLEKSKLAEVTSLQAATETNIGESHIELGAFDIAIEHLNKSIEISKNVNALRRIAISENKLAEVYNLKNIPDVALNYAKSALNYADKNENISIKRTALKHLSEAYEKRAQTSMALETYKEFKTLSDSILNKEKVKTIEELRAAFDLEKKETAIVLQEKEIETLNQEVEISNLRKGLYAGGMFTFVAVSGLLFFGFKQLIKKNRIEREKQEEIYKQEIEFKKKELASQTLHLVQKNTFIQELKENLEKIKQSPELFKIEFRRLVMLLKKESAEDKDWEVFKSYFSEVHNNFDIKLKDIYTDITEKEIRLASFLRMNLSTKEIASMLNVLPDSVLKSKYRLKKKLDLDKETDLNDFLSGL
ncbi:tetratricopeptide repeat protein [Flavobacteriaceae bacterium SZ-1-7]|uniref:tetratricopeptide repeat protein n=1 Tax=Tamlana sedimenti TaxID=3134126 RepID=UPI0031244F5E